MFCKEHVDDIYQYYSDVIALCIKAACRCIPTTSKPKIAGWDDHVRHFKDKSICFWHRIAIDNVCQYHG